MKLCLSLAILAVSSGVVWIEMQSTEPVRIELEPVAASVP